MRWFWQDVSGPPWLSPSLTPPTSPSLDSTAPQDVGGEASTCSNPPSPSSSPPNTLLTPPSVSSTAALLSPTNLLTTLVLTTTLLALHGLVTTRLIRIPNTKHLPPSYLQSRPTRSIFGRCTSVGDADNFRIFHTPGGLLLGWQLVRFPPSTRKALVGQTLHVRIAGIDAPELAHFGRPAQPYADDAMKWLTNTLEGRTVRVYTLRRDQYERVVGTAFLRRSVGDVLVQLGKKAVGWGEGRTEGGVLRRDVGLEMIRAGWATVYEAKVGAEFGASGMEAVYREAERRAKSEGRGMWRGIEKANDGSDAWEWLVGWLPWRRKRKRKLVDLESPREYKTRMAKLDEEARTKSTALARK